MTLWEKFPGVKWGGPKNWDAPSATGSWTNITERDRKLIPAILLTLFVGIILIGSIFQTSVMVVVVYSVTAVFAMVVFGLSSVKRGSFLEFIGLGDPTKTGVYVKQGLLLTLIFTFISLGLVGLTQQSFTPVVPQSLVDTNFPTRVAEIARQSIVHEDHLQALAFIVLGAIVIASVETFLIAIILASLVRSRGINNGIVATTLVRILAHYGPLWVLAAGFTENLWPLFLSGVFLIVTAPYVLSARSIIPKWTTHSGVNTVAYALLVFPTLISDTLQPLTNPIVAGAGVLICAKMLKDLK